jgi:hypothetical protein
MPVRKSITRCSILDLLPELMLMVDNSYVIKRGNSWKEPGGNSILVGCDADDLRRSRS